MNQAIDKQLTGGCTCGHVRYQLIVKPMFVHCCHCSWCQRESGTAFAINALIESSAVHLTGQEPVIIDTPSESGRGQQIARCPHCQVAVWSHYGGKGPVISFIKVGTLDDPNQCPPDIHIFTQSKQCWFQLPENTPTYPQYYDRKAHWPEAALQRFEKAISVIENKVRLD